MMKKKICLNMIVKNESKIIKETLLNISKYIDYWIISDTGSTDNTIEIIQNTFEELNIPGKIFNDEWEDFGTNRTKAIEHAYLKCDYIFVFDADDLIMGDLILPLDMNKDMYNLKFGNEITYTRSLIFKSTLEWKYKGILHEYACCKSITDPSNELITGNYYIESRRLGNRNNDEQKYLNDANLLIKAVNDNKEPDLKSRYLFYIGQSLYDHKDYLNAMIWYKKRINEYGWIEEIYYSNLRISFCMEHLNNDMNIIINQYIATYMLIPDRPEALYYLSIYYKVKAFNSDDQNYKKKMFEKSLNYLLILKKQNFNSELNDTRLFLNKEIYTWLCDYELALINYYLENYTIVINICKELLDKNILRLNDNIYEQFFCLSNLANDELDNSELLLYPKKYIDYIIKNKNNRDENLNNNIVCTMTTCKRLDLFIKTINSFINCCKDIEMIDEWIIVDDNSSFNDREIMKYEYPFVKWIFKDETNKGHANSMNILLDLTKKFKYVIHLEDDWEFIEKNYYIKPSLDILESNNYTCVSENNFEFDNNNNKEICQVLFNLNYMEDFEKIIYGGFLMETKTNLKTKFILHEHYTTDIHKLNNKINCAYWPHFSFRPSIFKRKILDTLEHYENKDFFERKYADKFYLNGFLSCFFDKITCIHIGKKTNQLDGLNAYELNDVNQHTNTLKPNNICDDKFIFLPNQDSYSNDIYYLNNNFINSINSLMLIADDIDDCICFNTYGYFKNKFDTNNIVNLNNIYNCPDGLYININKLHLELICLNLKRRNDRKEIMEKQFNSLNINYNFFTAIDGNELIISDDLIKLFKNNDFGSRKGVIGCALSYQAIFNDLINDKYKNYYIIVEDDTKLHKNFKKYLIDIQLKLNNIDNWDIIFLSYTSYENNGHQYNLNNFDDLIDEIKIIKFNSDIYIGGTYSFIVSKNGAKKILNYIETNGIKHGIDYLIKIVPNLNIFQLEKFITKSEWVKNIYSNVDYDIQKNQNFLDIYSDENFQYIRNKDSKDDDIDYINNISIDEMKKKALDNLNCICFNSLGFFKSKLNDLTNTIYYNNVSDGLYIKKSYLTSVDNTHQIIHNTNNTNNCNDIIELF